ncbi:MAG TPA: hypothetical protein VN247_03220 [Arenimonas sp.]|nr:hypothetical protein [Arenimonas sp.]
MWTGILFAFLGIFGSALPGFLGMRILAHREQLDRQIPFAQGTENSILAHGWWLMRFKQSQYPQAKALRQFGNIAGIFGWIVLIALMGCVFSFFMTKS